MNTHHGGGKGLLEKEEIMLQPPIMVGGFSTTRKKFCTIKQGRKGGNGKKVLAMKIISLGYDIAWPQPITHKEKLSEGVW